MKKCLQCQILVFFAVIAQCICFAQYEDSKPIVKLGIDLDSVSGIKVRNQDAGALTLHTTSLIPRLITKPFSERLAPEYKILSFEYICPQGFDVVRIWLGPPFDKKSSKLVRGIAPARDWTSCSIDLSEIMDDWGDLGDFLKIDLGDDAGVNVRLRNIHLYSMDEQEKEVARIREKKKLEDSDFNEQIKAYLQENYASKINSVKVDLNAIQVEGTVVNTDNVYLCEVPPYADVTKSQDFETTILLKDNHFTINLDRYIDRNGLHYDRLLSKWVLMQKAGKEYKLLSHGRYADEITSKYDLPVEKPSSKKGLGGFHLGKGPLEDLDELGITSVTVNIRFPAFMYTQPGEGRIAHTYNGKTYYFGKRGVDGLDATLQETAKRNIIVGAILLVNKASQCPDPVIGRLLQHPDMDPAGNYSMPNMTNPESVDCYAAALDFLADRYSRPDKKYGRIHHWIMHNEINMGYEWTNMGQKPEHVYMDAYIKSMHMCYNIARSYNPHSEVLVSLTRSWLWRGDSHQYRSKDLLDILLGYTKAEGDFQWGMANHPYPESLFEPKVWLDKQALFSFETPMITFKNLEVLNTWMKLPEVLYQGKYKRTLWLSENGTNSRTYSEQDLKEQAAGLAYAWKKVQRLDAIDAMQWHNWIDGRREYGLRIGLRRFPDDETDPMGKKPVWHVYQAAGTDDEDRVFAPYKKVVRIDDWEQVHHIEQIK